jgi:hypothetical protein
MANDADDFLFEYLNNPSAAAEERLAQAWDLIIEMILEDFENAAELQRGVGASADTNELGATPNC